MTQNDIQPAIDMLRAKHTIDNPATIEDMAAACGIDINAPFSYREVLDMAETIALSPNVVRFWINGERRYYARSAADARAIDRRMHSLKSGEYSREVNSGQ